ncbi:TetR/AcrR family transcriptional regulator [Streptomyces luteolus]|uniref:TetR/AcrR family transcriptional regulator n=1 Tax=Streptomyces luteolus TaxID=3043615 RepID=A0ABT6SQZ2_9ACTN|nr:TetR/AcrR family transcriptional regulator [Streptomyces sp. B-S-A12]MDI3418022.1 TetR/AcrR family transcriptional regulator [Streptomyces sp. B-S-A12]
MTLHFEPAPRPSARSRLLAAADDLFYAHGVDATGVDAIIEAADVARMTFYKHFRGKDALVVAYLEQRDARWRRLLAETCNAAGPQPQARIRAVFDALATCHSEPGFRGCSFANAAAELAHRDHPARAIVQGHKEALRADLARFVDEAEFLAVDELVDVLLILYEGASTTQALGTVTDAIAKAQATVDRLLDSWPKNNPAAAGRPTS